ncbi:MAG: hypothetical protein JW700_04355 [Candidatus Aenigmarchaeota archaeon]|nr:hypothetical protein [Candidatus Aenigmarchaeota archaeon]
MKYILISLLILVSISMCTGSDISQFLPGQSNNILQTGDYLYFDVDTIPSSITSGRDLTLIFQVTNNNNYDIRDLKIEAYDTCIFTGSSYYVPNEGSNNQGVLKANQSKTWKWVWKAGETRLEKNCDIKIKAEYKASFSLQQDIVVLSQDEYLSRQTKGTLNSIPANSGCSDSPLRIDLTFPESMPFIEDTLGYSMTIDYYNTGDGFLSVNKNEINITESENIEMDTDCNGYFSNGELRFINNKAPKTTCYFETNDIDQPISIETMEITADYTYMIDRIVSVKVGPSNTVTINTPSSEEQGTKCADMFTNSIGQCVDSNRCIATCNYMASDCQAEGMCCCNEVR